MFGDLVKKVVEEGRQTIVNNHEVSNQSSNVFVNWWQYRLNPLVIDVVHPFVTSRSVAEFYLDVCPILTPAV